MHRELSSGCDKLQRRETTDTTQGDFRETEMTSDVEYARLESYVILYLKETVDIKGRDL